MSAPVGADIESLCSKCGDVWHVVVAKVGERIAKVQCKQCSGFHRYKPPPGAGAPATTKGAKVAAAVAGAGAKKAPARKKVSEPAPPSVAPDMSKPVRRYAPGDSFIPGERIAHPTFGQGVVEALPGAGKIQVAFPDGSRRVLAVAKAADSLGRPTNRPHEG